MKEYLIEYRDIRKKNHHMVAYGKHSDMNGAIDSIYAKGKDGEIFIDEVHFLGNDTVYVKGMYPLLGLLFAMCVLLIAHL